MSDLLDLSNERDVQLVLRQRAYTDGWEAGHVAGVGDGRQAEAAERARAWNRIARPIARGGPAYAELELRRWGPGGREHFGDPRPGDFTGRPEGAA